MLPGRVHLPSWVVHHAAWSGASSLVAGAPCCLVGCTFLRVLLVPSHPMNPRGQRAVGGLVLVVGWALLGACGNSPAPVTATVAPVPPGAPPPVPEAPDGPIPSLRTATQPPVDHPDPLPARVERRSVDGGLE